MSVKFYPSFQVFGLKPKLGKECPPNLVSRCPDGTPMRPLVARTKGTLRLGGWPSGAWRGS